MISNQPEITDISPEQYLLTELPKPQTKEQLGKIRHWVLQKPERFDALVKLFITGNFRITQRGARIISQLADDRPELVRPYLPQIAYGLPADSSGAIKRNIIRVLQVVELTEELQGEVAELCFTFIQNPKEPIAVRAFSITVLAKICLSHPELARELLLLLDDILPFAAPAIKVRGREAIKLLTGNKSKHF